MRKSFRIENVEEAVYQLDLEEIADDIIESEEDYQLVISGWWINVPALGLNLHEGVYCRYDEKEKEYLPDFSVTVIKEEGQEEWIYFEQDGFIITLANWLNGKMRLNELEQMECFICRPEKE